MASEEQIDKQDRTATAFRKAIDIMNRLRGPDGCPWDREQNFDTIRRYTLEETYEVFDAIERRDWLNLREELGDLLLQILFYAQMASESNYFTIADVIEGLNRKLIRRHPHVFGEAAAADAGNAAKDLATEGIDAAQVLRNWDQIKQAEKGATERGEQSRLDSIPRSMPALLEAAKLGARASKCGFDWPDIEGLFDKLSEETEELKQAIDEAKQDGTAAAEVDRRTAVEAEVGDLLFTAVNLARRLKVDPEMALRGTNQKFRRRFRLMESAAAEPLESLPLATLDQLWNEAKARENRMDGEGDK